MYLYCICIVFVLHWYGICIVFVLYLYCICNVCVVYLYCICMVVVLYVDHISIENIGELNASVLEFWTRLIKSKYKLRFITLRNCKLTPCLFCWPWLFTKLQLDPAILRFCYWSYTCSWILANETLAVSIFVVSICIELTYHRLDNCDLNRRHDL